MPSIGRLVGSLLLAGLVACGAEPETMPPRDEPAADSVAPAPADSVMARDTAAPASS